MADRSGQQIGNYRLVRRLGRGAFAEVYLGEHRYLKNYAALKVLRTSLKDEDVERFLSEAQTLVRLIHPNIVRVLEFVIERGTPVLIMDYAPGGTARDHHPRGSCLSLATTVNYVKQVAAALQYAHNHNIIHRDIKPENILVGSGQQILLSDFGIALLAPSPELLSTQDMAGTVPYIAPEQVQGRPTFASDQYSLGIVAYEWLCGRRPFEGNEWEILRRHVHEAPPPLRETYPELPAEVENVVLRALAKDPQQRYVSVQAFARALERATQASKLDDSDNSEVTSPLRERSESPFVTLPDKTSRSIFLSASPADDAFAARLEADLKARGVPIEHVPHMLHSEDVVRQAIRAAHIALVVISPNTRSSRTVKEHLQIVGIYERQLIFVWAEGDDIATLLPEAWGKAAVIDLIDARENHYELALEEILARLQRESSATEPIMPSLSETLGEPRNPYKGLRAFTKDDSADFFGRDELIQELAQTIQHMLASAQPGTRGARLLTVIGPSGSGKSSVVMAGLLPQLSRGMLSGSEEWEYLEPMVPEKHPIESLALRLAPHLPNRSLKTICEDLEDDSGRGLHLLATQVVKRPGARVVLMVDQFEEVFASTVAEEERQHFIDVLVTAATELRGPVIVILTLRADFYDRPLSYEALGRLIENHHHVVLPMDTENLRAIIEQPAALPDVQLTFEGNLIGDMLFEAQGQAGALPLLEFTLDELFQRRDGHWLTLQAYQEIGGVKGALAKHAESTYASLPSDEHRRLARALFLRLIDPGMTEQDTTRRRANLAELSLPDSEQTKVMQEAANAFVKARLLTTNVIEGITTIEVSHEALIREWTRLSEWLHESREDIPRQQAISRDAAEWERRGRKEDWVYRGDELDDAQEWAGHNVPSTEEVAFLKASVAEQQRQEELERSRQERERKLQRQTVNRLRGLVAVISLFLVASIVFASVIGINLQQNMQLLQIARSRALAANAIISLSQNELDRALLLSVKANKAADTYEARNSLLTTLEYSPQIVTMLRQESPTKVNTLALSSNDRVLVSSDDNGVSVWDTQTRAHHTLPLDLVTMGVRSIAVSPDGQVLVTSSSDGVWTWDLRTGSRLSQLDGKITTPANVPTPTFLAFSWDGMYLASGRCYAFSNTNGPTCTETDMIVWNMLTKQQIGPPCPVHANVNSIALSPDGMILAYGSDTSVGLCKVSTGVDSPLSGSTDANSVAFSPDGKLLASGGNERTIQLWDMTTRKPFGSPLAGQADAILSLAFSRNSDLLVSGSKDKTIWVWNVASEPPIGSALVGHTNAVTSLAFSRNSNILASGSLNGIILLWDIDAVSPIGQRSGATGGGLWSAVFSPDGKTVFTGSDDGNIFPYDVKTGQSLDPLNTVALYHPRKAKPGEHEFLSRIQSLVLSRNGQVLAVGRRDGTILLWNLKTRKVFAHLQQTNLLTKIALSSDAQIVTSEDDAGTITLWNVAKQLPTHVLAAPGPKDQSSSPSLAISSDDKTLAVGGCARLRADNSCEQGQIVLWNIATGQRISLLRGQPAQPSEVFNAAFSDVAFSPDGQTLASSNQAGIVLWNLSTSMPATQPLSLPVEKDFPDYSDYYDHILFSPDGKLLASYSMPGPSFSFVLWDLTERKPLAHAFHFPETSTQGSIAFSPNGQQLASVVTDAANNNIVTLWDITIQAWQEHACAIANRNLTQAEWTQFVSNEPYSKVCPNLPLPPAASSS